MGLMSRLGSRVCSWRISGWISSKLAVVPMASGTEMCQPPLVERSLTVRAPQDFSHSRARSEIGVDLVLTVGLAVEVERDQVVRCLL